MKLFSGGNTLGGGIGYGGRINKKEPATGKGDRLQARKASSVRRFILTVLLVCVSLPSSASAITLTNTDGSPAEAFQAWADTSKMPTAPGRVFVFTPDTPNAYDYCSGEAPACAYGGAFPSINFVTGDAVRPSIFFHEMGHIYDYSMPAWKRQMFYEITGYGPSWRGGANPAAERFAVAYQLCAQGVRNVGKRWVGRTFVGRKQYGYDYSPRSPRVHHAVCRLIAAPN